MNKREWYIAVCSMSGEFAGNPPSFEAATIYGPYTHEQVAKAAKIGDGFPHETYSVETFKADDRPPFRSLLRMLREQVAKAT
jgi:hypothetical protein